MNFNPEHLKKEKDVIQSIKDPLTKSEKLGELIDSNFVEFMLRHKKFFDYYAGSSNIEIKSHRELPPSQQGTFAIDLKNDTIYAAMDVFKEKGYEDDTSFFAMLHEFEHFRELRDLIKYYNHEEDIGGSDIWEKHYKKLSSNRALGILDNCVDDIKMNRTVLDRAPSLIKTKDHLYTTFNFPNDDLRTSPLHLQLAFALLRRRMLPNNETIVDERVEQAIARIEKDPINGMNIVDYMTRPEINMAERLMLQEALIEPEFLKLLEQAKIDKINKEQQNSSGESQEGESQEGESQEGESQEGESQEGESQEGESQESAEQKKQNESQGGQSENSEYTEPKTANDPFDAAYQEYEERNPQATQLDAINDAFKKYAESAGVAEKPETQNIEKNLEQRQLEALAEHENVSVQDIKNYQDFWDDIKKLENPKTNESVVNELREVFKKIITKRQPLVQSMRSRLDEGSEIEDYAEIVSGAMNHHIPEKIWTDFEKKEKTQKLVGNFDVSFVCDRSYSMNLNDSAKQQRIAVGLFLEMFSEFSDSILEARLSAQNSLEIQTEVWGFGDESEVGVIKPMGQELSLHNRVNSYNALSNCPGNKTLDYRPLQEIERTIDNDIVEKIRTSKYKKIVIVITDGVSSDNGALAASIHKLHQKGVTVVAIGLGRYAQDIAQNYPNAIMCPSPHSLGSVTGELLAHISKNI